MQLSALNIPEKKLKQLEKLNIHTAEDLLAFYPRKYMDRSRLTGVDPNLQESVFLFHCKSVKLVNGKTMFVVANGFECYSQLPVSVKWFNQPYLYHDILETTRLDILVAGQVTVNTYGGETTYEVANPALYDPEGMNAMGYYPVYRKVPGMAEEYLQNCIFKAAEHLGPPAETVPENILIRHGLLSHSNMVKELHWPSDEALLKEAQRRKLMDDLLYFALRVELNYRGAAIGSPFGLPVIRTAAAIRKNLPFELTADQAAAVDGMYAWIRSGRRVNALVQGDVGSGKTIVAFLLMIAMAENGYQAALMAPTQILAQQHYKKLVKLVEPYGIQVAFVSGQKLRKAEQKALADSISSGEVKLVVGTQALLSDSYQFKNLAMVIEDEEHKYGVMQRQALIDKAACGTHTITMTATPIPRSLALTIYGNNVQVYSIKTKPAGRKPVATGIQPNMERIFRYLRNMITTTGHQAYVVCPMVSPSEKVQGVSTVEETFERYRRELEPSGIRVGMVTGKTKKTEAQEIIREFSANEISVLISTTVIEVGVDVPNATCIVIHNAERFGLAQLHQLRGRVGRGSDQAYCVLSTAELDNPRLAAMVQTTDGFKISEIDLQLRGAGDILGNQQSGTEKLLRLALQNQCEYKAAQRAAKDIIESGANCLMLEQAMEDQKNNIGGEMLTE